MRDLSNVQQRVKSLIEGVLREEGMFTWRRRWSLRWTVRKLLPAMARLVHLGRGEVAHQEAAALLIAGGFVQAVFWTELARRERLVRFSNLLSEALIRDIVAVVERYGDLPIVLPAALERRTEGEFVAFCEQRGRERVQRGESSEEQEAEFLERTRALMATLVETRFPENTQGDFIVYSQAMLARDVFMC